MGNDKQPDVAVFPQYFVAFITNLISLTYGCILGWVAPVQPILQANYTGTNETSPLGVDAIPLTDEDVSWIGGFLCVGGILGTPLYGYFASLIGRKKSCILAVIPLILSYVFILIASSSFHLFIARFLGGVGGAGVCVIVPMYVGETALDDARGILGSFFNLFLCLGILFSYIVGSYTSYFTFSVLSLSFPAIFLVCSIWLPETPIYLLTQNEKDQARQALIKLRGNNAEAVNAELAQLSASLKESSSNKEGLSLKDMISEPATRLGLIIGCGCMMIQQFSGISPIIAYTVAIFEASGSKLSANIATIVVGTLQLIGAFLATLLMDIAGRRLLLLISSGFMAVSLLPIAIFFRLKSTGADEELMQSLGLVPVLSMSVYIVVYAVGFGPVPWVLVGELFSNEAKSKASTICVLYVWFLAFLLIKFFPNLSNLIGSDGCFAMFSLCCFLGLLFVYFIIPETKGKSSEEILTILGKKSHNTPLQLALTDIDTKTLHEKKFEFTSVNNGLN